MSSRGWQQPVEIKHVSMYMESTKKTENDRTFVYIYIYYIQSVVFMYILSAPKVNCEGTRFHHKKNILVAMMMQDKLTVIVTMQESIDEKPLCVTLAGSRQTGNRFGISISPDLPADRQQRGMWTPSSSNTGQNFAIVEIASPLSFRKLPPDTASMNLHNECGHRGRVGRDA